LFFTPPERGSIHGFEFGVLPPGGDSSERMSWRSLRTALGGMSRQLNK
jgi:hypothetical protein